MSDTLKRIIHYSRIQNKYVKTIIIVLFLVVVAALVQVSKEAEVIGEEKHVIELQAARNAVLVKKIQEEKNEIQMLKAEVSQNKQGIIAPGSAPVTEEMDVEVVDHDFLWVPYASNDQVAGLHVVITSLLIGQGLEQTFVDARMAMFKTLCVPTMKAQQSQNFLWLIFIDDTLLDEVVQDIREQLAGYSNYKLVMRKEGRWRGPSYNTDAFPQRNSVAKMFAVAGIMWTPPPDDKNPIIITTRLDSDDGLHPSATAEIQDAAVEWDQLRARLPGFVCWNNAALWMANAENPLGSLGSEQPPYGPDTGCLVPGLSMFTRDTDQRSVFWEGHTTRIRNLTINNMKERLLDRLKVLSGNLDNVGIPPQNSPMNVPIRSRTVTGVGVLGMQSSALPTAFSHTYDQYKRGLELSFPKLDFKKFEAMNAYFVESERDIIRSTLSIKCVSVPGGTCNPKTKSRVRAIEMARPDVGILH